MNTAKKILHPVMRAWIRVTCYFFFDEIHITGQENIPNDGPVIVASNHPDSFLDALLITAFYKRSLHYLARGDVFSSPFVSKILRFLNIVPIFRREEGTENLSKNDATFSFCLETFKEDGSILIFSEGGSTNEWNLRTLRKGTARLAYSAWKDNTIAEKLTVLPVSINYSSWLSAKNTVYLSFQPIIESKQINTTIEQPVALKRFNDILKEKLAENCVIIDKSAEQENQKILSAFFLKNLINGREVLLRMLESLKKGDAQTKNNVVELATYLKENKISYLKRSSFATFLLCGILYNLAFVFNCVPYLLSRRVSKVATNMDEFYDSVLFCVLLFLYPIYLAILFIVMYFIFHSFLLGAMLIALTLLTAKLGEWAKGNIQGYLKRAHYDKVKVLTEKFL